MKRTSTEKPVLSVVFTIRNSATKAGIFDGTDAAVGFDGKPLTMFERCLKSVRERAPECEICILDTISSDARTLEIAKLYADKFATFDGPKHTWTMDSYAVDDMAAARNESFKLATGEFCMWLDDDDLWVGPEEAQRILKANGRWHPTNGNIKDKDQAEAGQAVSIEEMLKRAVTAMPDLEGFKAPYAYRFEENDWKTGKLAVWNPRERIVRNNGKWFWARPAHEILVSKDASVMGRTPTLTSLLIVHQKKWDDKEAEYSLNRHYDILIKRYDSGEQLGAQELLYLENFSMAKCPHRRQEFIDAIYKAANIPFDRMRALTKRGNYYAERGFHMEAMEAFSAATGIFSGVPDPYIACGMYLNTIEDYLGCADWILIGCTKEIGHPLSEISPREQVVDWRAFACMALLRGAQKSLQFGNYLLAEDRLLLARNTIVDVVKNPTLVGGGADHWICMRLMYLIENEYNSLVRVRELHEHWKFLVANDETQKARKVLDLVPHNVESHPLISQIQAWAKTLDKHLIDPEAYAKFYEDHWAGNADADQDSAKAMPSTETMLDPATAEPRVKFAIEQLKSWGTGAPIHVLDVGSFDGIVTLPLLKALPDVIVTALEAQSLALNRLTARAKADGFEARFTPIHGLDVTAATKGNFDAVMFFEVIEHVQDPVKSVRELLHALKPSGRLFLSTPWGAYDKGHPQSLEKRDKRGHVRALMPWDVVKIVEEAGGRVLELGGCHSQGNFGDTMHLMCERRGHELPKRSPSYHQGNPTGITLRTSEPPLVFSVPAALWDWNGSHVESTGIGASEETIVYLSRAFAGLGRDVSVYGPMPAHQGLAAEEVRWGVKYWHRSKIDRIPEEATVVVSRAPTYGAAHNVKDQLLWLQDIPYPDLNTEVANRYRRVIAVSNWHKQALHKLHAVPMAKITVIPNFLLPEHFDDRNPIPKPTREPHAFLYASSPDRGLITLLKLWPHILRRWPDATLRIFYGWQGAAKLTQNNPEWVSRYNVIRGQFEKLKLQNGVMDIGRVNHWTIAREFQRASVWAYPTAFAETDCNTARKARAGGCIPICTPYAGLNESAPSELTSFIEQPEGLDPFSTGEHVEKHKEWRTYVTRYIEAIAKAFETPDEKRDSMAADAIEHGSIDVAMQKWKELL